MRGTVAKRLRDEASARGTEIRSCTRQDIPDDSTRTSRHGTSGRSLLPGRSHGLPAVQWEASCDTLQVGVSLVSPYRGELQWRLTMPKLTNATCTQTFYLALAIWREARGEPQLGRTAVGYSILNRVARPSWWGRTVDEVITKKWQYSSLTDPRDKQLPRWDQSGTNTAISS